MSGATYDIRLTDPAGNLLLQLDPRLVRLDCTLVVNAIGTLQIAYPLDKLSRALFRRENHIEIRRRPDGGVLNLLGEKVWIIRSPGFTITERGERLLTAQADCCNTLLKRRGTWAYDAGASGYTSFASAPLDNTMKALINTNFGAGATDTARSIASYLSIEANHGAGASAAKDCAQRSIDSICQELANTSEQAGTPLFFDVSWTGTGFLFRTFTGQRGVDRRSSSSVPLLVGPNYGNLVNITYIEDGSDEYTYVYARGQGIGASRADAFATDAGRAGLSPIGRIEGFVDARSSSSGALQGEANAALRAHIPRISLSGRVQDTPQCRFGVHWNWGDRLPAEVEGVLMDARADAVHITLASQKEVVDAWFRGIVA